MRQLWIHILFILTLLTWAAMASAEAPCESLLRQEKAELCAGHTQKNLSELQEVGLATRRLDWFQKQSQSLQTEVDRQKHRLAEMLRNLRDGNSSTTGAQQARQLEDRAQKLSSLLEKINEISEKQAICSTSCSASRKTELDAEYQKLQLHKTQLLSLEPLLLHSAVESSLKKGDRGSALRQALIQSLSEHAVQLDQLSLDIDKLAEDPQQPLGESRKDRGMVKYAESVASRHRNVLESLVGGDFPHEGTLPQQRAWCFYRQELNGLQNRDLALTIGSEVALWGVGTLLNPPAAIGSRLLKAGSQTAKWGLRTSRALQGLTFDAKALSRAEHLSQTVASRSEVVKSLASDSPASWAANQSLSVYKVGNKEHMAIMDLGRAVRLKDEEVLQTSRRYWEHVGNVYKDRLNLSEKEIKDFLSSSEAMKDRTILITSSEEAPLKTSNFNGGAGIVLSRKSQDLLPLEKATGLTVDRSSGGVAEVVRLTAQNVEAKDLSKDLLFSTAEILKNEKNIQTIYVYTSKAHARLYKSMGVPIRREQSLDNKRDVILTIKVSDLTSP